MLNPTESNEAVKTLLAAGAASVEIKFLSEDVFGFVLPEGYTLKEVDLEKFSDHPRRIQQHIHLGDGLSFVTYFQKFADDSTVIFANLEKREITAVFDYHTKERPAWREHKATLNLQWSTEWKPWNDHNKRPFEQEAFAEFIQMNLPDFVAPSGAELLEIAQTLQAKKKVDFISGVRLDNGQTQLTYSETIEGTAGPKGNVKIPEKFLLALRVFNGMERYKVEAYLRYRIGDDKKLRFFYQLERPERIIEDAFEQVKKQIQTGCSCEFYSVG